MLICCVLLGLDWAESMMFLYLHVICSCIFMHAYLHFFMFLYIDLFVVFLHVSLSPSLSFFLLVASWHLNENPLCPRTLFVLGHPLPLTPLLLLFGSVMIKLERTFQRTSLDEAFIRNAKSFYRISLILTFPLSFTVRVGSHCVASRLRALPWSYMILLQHARIWLLYTLVCHLHSGYTHCSYSGSYIRGATRS